MRRSRRLLVIASSAVVFVVVLSLIADRCAGGDDAVVPIDAFPVDWPVAVPPGGFDDCPNGGVTQEDLLFSAVVCLPNRPDPVTAAGDYLEELERDRFVEREPGRFGRELQTFLDGNGIEIFYQLQMLDDAEGRRNELTVVLIKPAG